MKSLSKLPNHTVLIKQRTNPRLQAIINKLPTYLKHLDISRTTVVEKRSQLQIKARPFQSETISLTEKQIESNGRTVKVFIYQPKEVETLQCNVSTAPSPAILWIHGGGYIMGSAREDATALHLIDAIKGPIISVDYGLAPENPFPAGIEDCYATLLWLHKNAAKLKINPAQIIVGGTSAGGGLAASLSLMSRDRKGPPIAYQILHQPMLDNLHELPSARVHGHPIWNRNTSINAWEMYLSGTPAEAASPYAAAMRANNLSDLPPALVTVGALDLFRDECIAYAQRLLVAGISTELIVYPGVIHGTLVLGRKLPIGKKMILDRQDALKRALGEI